MYYILGTYPDKQSFGPLPTKKASSSNIFATRSSTMELPEYMAPSWLCRSLSWPLWNLKYKWRLQSKTDVVISQSQVTHAFTASIICHFLVNFTTGQTGKYYPNYHGHMSKLITYNHAAQPL